MNWVWAGIGTNICPLLILFIVNVNEFLSATATSVQMYREGSLPLLPRSLKVLLLFFSPHSQHYPIVNAFVYFFRSV